MKVLKKKLNLNKIKKILKKKKVDGYILATTDEYLNEYSPLRNQRLKWLTGFSGSNGTALILKNTNYFFTDGRYTLQAEKELPENFKILDSSKENIFIWIKKNLIKKKIIIDSKINSISLIKKFQIIFNDSNNNLIIYDQILLDKIWEDRPLEKIKNLYRIPIKISGLSANNKLNKVISLIDNFDYYLITSPESICWLLNIRGSDLLHTPIVFCRLLLQKNGKHKLFINKKKITPKIKEELSELGVKIFEEQKLEEKISNISKKKISLDIHSPYYFYEIIKKKFGSINCLTDPCKILKAKKNSIELVNTKKIHVFDAVAVVKFFCWFEKQKINDNFNEISVADKLEFFRKKNKYFVSPSFPTISSTGSNSAIIHYNPYNNSNEKIKPGQIYLCDSGGQYLYGTTDITRTIIVGKKLPKNNIKDFYTRVLKGHINLAKLIFPYNTKGVQIDAFARENLWSIGEDYNHGTGHGVGSFLGVHEGPQSITKSLINISLEPGMILSNEPGIYKENQFGIRIENLILVKKSKRKNFLEFETLSLVPFERKLINKSMLNWEQINWINDYHKTVKKKIYKYLDNEEKTWLLNKTKKI